MLHFQILIMYHIVCGMNKVNWNVCVVSNFPRVVPKNSFCPNFGILFILVKSTINESAFFFLLEEHTYLFLSVNDVFD